MGKFGVAGKMELKEANSKDEKEKKKMTFMDLWCNFRGSCTMHGIGHISMTHWFRGYVKTFCDLASACSHVEQLMGILKKTSIH